MGRPKRLPLAEVGDDGYLLVRHTHDVELARALMRSALSDSYWEPNEAAGKAALEQRLIAPFQIWVRIVNALPNSFAAAEGWPYQYVEQKSPSRGAFPAVVFR